MISLDHDLDVLDVLEGLNDRNDSDPDVPDDPETPAAPQDPGDGLDVAKFLVTQPTPRPVIVHSSNAARATQMMGEFELARWPATRVPPLEDSWIYDDWQSVARGYLVV